MEEPNESITIFVFIFFFLFYKQNLLILNI
nr:MAG TPA: hypothetical protein [Caudoviricetes sp.]DAR70456.1 MAG TPA: hypothetical protein [Caudoviricetes sp.]